MKIDKNKDRGAIMKVLKKNNDLCIGCHNCEEICSTTWFKEKNIEKSCIRIKDEKKPLIITACTQCGDCINQCPANAIYRDKTGVVRINKKLCVGCFICVGFCPTEAMFMHNDYIEPFKCTACGVCTKECKAMAIQIAFE